MRRVRQLIGGRDRRWGGVEGKVEADPGVSCESGVGCGVDPEGESDPKGDLDLVPVLGDTTDVCAVFMGLL